MQTPEARRWLFSRNADLSILFVPVWLTWVAAFALPASYHRYELPLWGWVVFVLALDVSHVWSTLYRTYLDPTERQHHRRLLWTAPTVAFGLLMLVNLWLPQYFWRIMAYYALYHFVKQQYGFQMIYSAKAGPRGPQRLSDKWMIYLSMLYPVAFWHLAARRFQWFAPNDFFAFTDWLPSFDPAVVARLWMGFHLLYLGLLLAWATQEWHWARQQGLRVPWAKILWLLTTAGNWFLGIVYFDSDIVFSITNVVAHGVPYLALIFFYVEKKRRLRQPTTWRMHQATWRVVAMLLGILALAYAEEYAWDALLNYEQLHVFAAWLAYPVQALQHPLSIALATSLLSLPQVTHYILDGYIWRSNPQNPYLKPVLFQ